MRHRHASFSLSGCQFINIYHGYLVSCVQVSDSFYAPVMTMAGELSVSSVRTSVRPSVRHTYEENSFDQNFMKPDHIV